MKNRLLLITRDEEDIDKNKKLFDTSILFCKELAFNCDATYFQLANIKYKNGLISRMLKEYLANTNEYAFGIATTLDGLDNLKNFSTSYYIQPSTTTTAQQLPETNLTFTTYTHSAPIKRLNIQTAVSKDIEYFASNFEYIILHHGGQEIIYYFSSLNNLLLNNANNSFPLKKLLLLNEDGFFNNLLKQYKSLISSGIDRDCIANSKIMSVSSLEQCTEIIQEMKIYTPGCLKPNFTVDE